MKPSDSIHIRSLDDKVVPLQTIQLPYSKSLYNRILILKALQNDFEACQTIDKNDANDVNVLKQNLLKIEQHNGIDILTLDCGPAGTAFRFLTAYCSIKQGQYLLTGSERMQQRPIGDLVDALRQLSIKIEYVKREGFPPLLIHGGKLNGETIHIRCDKSSQFLSSILLLAPQLANDLNIQILGQPVSEPYTEMTLAMLKSIGIHFNKQEQAIKISKPNQTLHFEALHFEADWSAASYWYAIVALSKDLEIKLPGLEAQSLQGDSVIQEIMPHFGVHTTFEDGICTLSKTEIKSKLDTIDCLLCPDLAQTIAVVAAAQNRTIQLTGLSTLVNKETNRLHALKTELEKVGAMIAIQNNDTLIIQKGIDVSLLSKVSFETYEDHRMAMCLAPLALLSTEGITIQNPEVVKKSYPLFWKDISKIVGID
jgi:3-phosphoshikimate 1-carboxyvinyltransferase